MPYNDREQAHMETVKRNILSAVITAVLNILFILVFSFGKGVIRFDK